MSKALLITFTPINKFFFGSSFSFGEGFYAESLKFPQPTTVLGCIRNTILIQNGLLSPTTITDSFSDKAKELTGSSIVERLDDSDDNFGVIEKISPAFIVRLKENSSEDFLFPAPADVMQDGNSLIPFGYDVKTNAMSNYSERKVEYAILSKRNPKLHKVGYFGGKEFWEAYMFGGVLPHNPDYEEENIFIRYTSVGIGREDRVTKEGMFYTKIDYSLKKNFAFGIILWLNENSILKDGVVIFGGEQSTFNMRVSVLKDTSHPLINMIINDQCNMLNNLKSCTNEEKLFALSPIVLDKDSNFQFARAMKHRIVKGMQVTRMIRRTKALKSEAISMIPAGSVFYSKEPVCLGLNWPIPHKIGYNYLIKTGR